MKRKCESCGELVGEDKLIACPKCGASLKSVDQPSTPELPPEVVERVVKSVWRRVFFTLFGGFSILTIIGLVLYAYSMHKAYQKGMAKVERDIAKAITAEFKTERIRATVQSVAQEQSAAILASNVMPVVTAFTNQTTAFLADADRLKQDIKTIRKQLREVEDMAEPPRLFWRSETNRMDGTDYVLTIDFWTTKQEPLGMLTFDVTITDKTDARILSIMPVKIGMYRWNTNKGIAPDGRKAKLVYSGTGVFEPSIEIKFTQCPDSIRIESSHFGKGSSYGWSPDKPK